MKIATWNVNSIRVRKDGVLDWLEAHEPDALCVQETKVVDQAFPEDDFADIHYEAVYFGQKTYNGVAIFSQDDAEDVVKGFEPPGQESEKRLIAATVGGVRIINVYVPNGQAYNSPKFQYKLRWLDDLRDFVRGELQKHEQLVLCGDFNIAPQDDDVWNIKEFTSGLFISPEERAKLDALKDCGLSDALKHLHPQGGQFTWWDYRSNGYAKNLGMRIDHILVSQPVLDRTKSVTIHKSVRGSTTPSDHVPVMIELEDA